MRSLQVLLAGVLASSGSLARDFCTSSEKCWPSPSVWAKFNSSVNGRLVAPRPPAWPCHDPNYDEAACNNVKANWNSSFWRSDQVGAMQSTIWESLGCNIDTPRNQTCQQGYVPAYSVEAQESSDVSKAVSFAAKNKIKLVVKNTGHDYLGRSSGAGSLSIWTHLLKGINFTDRFVADGCSNASGVSAVTVGAAEQWRDVYKAVDDRKVIVVGGAANSVGAAGGWLQGGGHSPLSVLHGMGVDNVLQFTVVKANACQNKDLFWALRGGGGGTWGVTLDVTYTTHPPLSGIVGLWYTSNVTSTEKLKDLTEVFFRIRGYAFWTSPVTFSFLAIHPNAPDVATTNNSLAPLFDWAAQNSGTQVLSAGILHPTFYSFFTRWITDIGIAAPVWIGGRLISKSALLKNSAELADLAVNIPPYMSTTVNIVGGGAVDKVDPESTGLNPQWRNHALVSWNTATGWTDDTPASTVELLKASITNVTQQLGKIGGLDQAAYFNEADPQEPQWKKAFFEQPIPRGPPNRVVDQTPQTSRYDHSPAPAAQNSLPTPQGDFTQSFRNDFLDEDTWGDYVHTSDFGSAPQRRALVIAISYEQCRYPVPLWGAYSDAYKIIGTLSTSLQYT
ncbi:FAD-binding domain protein [Ceratobasidium sp. AG-Ba]|nr:FAD-binding domain protein [Ceratobasidium sp. AG-Ba]